MRTQSDARLVDLVRAGNDRAFEAIVLRYHRPLLRHCRRLLPVGRAEDAVQQAFLRALEAIRADERELQLGAWLHRIAHNAAIDALRRLGSDWEELDERIDGVEAPHAAAERRARFRSVVASLGALPERQRRALVLRELEGRSYEEIAATLDVSGAGVRQLLNRARNTMRAGATALVPFALVGRLAGSQTGVRVAELVEGPGMSGLLAKGTAAVAAGAVALFAATGTPGDRPHAHANPGLPELETRAAGTDLETRGSTAGDGGGPTGDGGTRPARGDASIDRRTARQDSRPAGEGPEGGTRPRRQGGSAGPGGGQEKEDEPPRGPSREDPPAIRHDDDDDDAGGGGEPDDDGGGDETTDEATDEGVPAADDDGPDDAPIVSTGFDDDDAHSVDDDEAVAQSGAPLAASEDDDPLG